MPPRYAYWTILIDNTPTAFRAREKEELLPTFHQLQRTNKDVVLKWFARGRLWDTPEAADAARREPVAAREKRGHDWRPGGVHKDPRDRFMKGGKRRDDSSRTPAGPSGSRDQPRAGIPRGTQPWRNKPRGATPRGLQQPWREKPRRDRPNAKPTESKARGESDVPGSPEPRVIKPDSSDGR